MYIDDFATRLSSQNDVNVERIDLTTFGRIVARSIVMAADLSRRHKSDDFNSFLIHLFF